MIRILLMMNGIHLIKENNLPKIKHDYFYETNLKGEKKQFLWAEVYEKGVLMKITKMSCDFNKINMYI